MKFCYNCGWKIDGQAIKIDRHYYCLCCETLAPDLNDLEHKNLFLTTTIRKNGKFNETRFKQD